MLKAKTKEPVPAARHIPKRRLRDVAGCIHTYLPTFSMDPNVDARVRASVLLIDGMLAMQSLKRACFRIGALVSAC